MKSLLLFKGNNLFLLLIILFSKFQLVFSDYFTNFSSWQQFDFSTTNPSAKLFSGAIYDQERYVYFIPFTQHSIVVRYDTLQSFSDLTSYNFYDFSSTSGLNCLGYHNAVFDPNRKKLYLVPFFNTVENIYHARFVRLDTSSIFDLTPSWTAVDAQNTYTLDGNKTVGYVSGCVDLNANRYMYFAPYTNDQGYQGKVLRLDLDADFSEIAFTAFDVSNIGGQRASVGYAGCVCDETRNQIFFVPYGTSSLLRYNASGQFSSSQSWNSFNLTQITSTSILQFNLGVISGQFLYLGAVYYSNPLRIDLSVADLNSNSAYSFFNFSLLTSNPTDPYYGGLVSLKGDVIYVPTKGPFIRVKTVPQNNFSVVSNWDKFEVFTIVGLENLGWYRGCCDDRYCYFPPFANWVSQDGHGIVMRVDTGAVLTPQPTSNPSSPTIAPTPTIPTTTPTQTQSTNNIEPSNSSSQVGNTSIVGIIVGVVLGVLVLCLIGIIVVVILIRKRNIKNETQNSNEMKEKQSEYQSTSLALKTQPNDSQYKTPTHKNSDYQSHDTQEQQQQYANSSDISNKEQQYANSQDVKQSNHYANVGTIENKIIYANANAKNDTQYANAFEIKN